MKPYYQDEAVTLYCGDCRDILPTITAPVDCVLTDPPYGVGLSGTNGKKTKHTTRAAGYLSTDDTPAFVQTMAVPVIAGAIARWGRVVLTPGCRNAHLYPPPAAVGTIFYPNGTGRSRWGFGCHNPIFYYGKDPYLAAGKGGRPDSLRQTQGGEKNGHPCPKPLAVMRWLVERTSFPGHLLLDPFSGSGTTLVAAKQLGRRAIGIEIEERYCAIAAERLAATERGG